jgi:copper transport protein
VAALKLIRALLLGAVMVAAPLSTAQAHASLLSSSPADGSRIAVAPNRVRLLFSEPIVAELSHLMIAGSDGKWTTLAVSTDPREVRAIESPLALVRDGGYRITWHIISADGHPVSGSFVFTVGSGGGPAPGMEMSGSAHGDGQAQMSDMEPSLAGAALTPALLRGLALSALLALCGLLAFVSYSPNESVSQLRICGWFSGIATGLLAVHLIVWLIHVSPTNALDAEVISGALSREVGLTELIRLVLTALSAWALLLARRTRLALAFALAAVIAGGAIGHPAAISPLFAIPSKSMHLVGVALWFGGIIWLAMLDLSMPDSIAAALMVSRIAMYSIIVVALTGINQSFLFIPSWRDVIHSAYGLTVLAKVAGLVVLTAFGAYHRYRCLPRIAAGGGSAGFARSIRREIAVMIIVIMLGGFLAYLPTPQMHSVDTHSTSHQGT